jgi:uncharacterized OB-fold protein
VSTSTSAVPAIEGWFTTDAEPHLLGTTCSQCGTFFFPREETLCRNPACQSTDLPEVRLSRTGTIWSYTNAGYQPPAPYVPTTDPYEPFAIAAVHLAAEDMVILGQVADGFGVDDLKVGDEVELVVETLFTEEGVDQLTWRWKPTGSGDPASAAETGGNA